MIPTTGDTIIDLGPYHLISMSDWPWHNFRPFEIRHRFDGRVYVVPSFMTRVQDYRSHLGFGMEVASYYRSPEYNDMVSGTGTTGPHTTGRAIDIRIAGEDAYTLQTTAAKFGFTGIGVHQKGPWDKRFIHLDDLKKEDGHPRPRLWSY